MWSGSLPQEYIGARPLCQRLRHHALPRACALRLLADHTPTRHARDALREGPQDYRVEDISQDEVIHHVLSAYQAHITWSS
jgi:DNA-binding NarL/FixJ family response regulator